LDRVLREIQTIRLFCDVGKERIKEEVDVAYLDFARNVQKVEGEIIEQAKTQSEVRLSLLNCKMESNIKWIFDS